MSSCMSGLGGMTQGLLSEGLVRLKGEHPALRKQMEELFALTQQIDQEIDKEKNFHQLIQKVKEFKSDLDPHSEREEGVLFPMMGVYIGTTSGPIAVMEYEHDQAKSQIGAFLEKAVSGQPTIDEQKKLAVLIQNAYLILTDHFNKEENVLFPMAERMLSDEEKAELLLKIQEIN
ncbi:hemerythrin-like domain-containing protein [Neobacillus cucumis]|uniref:hemerythrin domain-containing protein n=2 Tax=Neobacillus cucumis TaxID=1740721 RepID=UPI001EF955F0|nr:hemerythrin domain-containing protein [Neobacillus cucumis]MBM7654171.1 hemerythrin-like domain-containing protein [Neobacillus cucumis]